MSVSMMAIIILFGMLIGRRLEINFEAKRLLMMIIINIAVPAIIFNGIFNTKISDELLGNMLAIFIISIVLNMIGIGLGWLVARLFGFRSLKARKIAILAGIGNTGFIGIPLCAQIFGPTGGLLAAIFDAGLDVVVFTLVIMLLQQGEALSLRQFKAVFNIPVMAIMAGIIIAVIGYEPPMIAKELTATLANLAAPLAMIYVGLLIPNFYKQKKKTSLRFVSIPLVMKLLVFPFMMIALLQVLPLTSEVKQVAFIQVSMPTFMLATVLFARYADDEDTAVMTTVYSTLLSLLTIPFIAYVVSVLI
ncbi:AEC family transporter [Halalkalibacter nanhaiisediminis]|uniref:Auxin efflux carrier n=1 Tax=Halalkalibacter nanhaiisediminis TaxID=688079 RepID=A0A562QN39_9BACI|nr:AEC family transporter [Halalkalibacter nanhaiisediminis]TWI58083.1 hypothetical protein IQ10_01414 [Halalkalibacter nanhaiisediminis]